MDNGSGGMFEDIIINGGGLGLFTGNQQWTARNLTFNDCQTAIFQNWNWVYTYKSITINNCDIGFDMSQGGNVITTSSMVIQDSVFNNVSQAGIISKFSNQSTPTAAGTLVLDNVEFVNTPIALTYANNTDVVLTGNRKIKSFVQGTTYSVFDGLQSVNNETCYEPEANFARVQTEADPPPKPVSLLDADGKFFERSKPQYIGEPASSFVSIMDYGCSNDGKTDVTACVQDFLNSITTGQIAFIDQGAYVISDTITVPNNIKIIGEIWPLFMVDGSSSTFSDMNNPTPAFRVGQPGDVGAVEMSEIIFQTIGPAPGAIMMEWNLAAESQGANG